MKIQKLIFIIFLLFIILLFSLILFTGFIEEKKPPYIPREGLTPSQLKAFSICEKIESQDLSIFCMALTTDDITLCDEFGDESKDYCIWDMASLYKNESICERLENVSFGGKGKDSCYRIIAIDKEDLALCEKILDQERREYCISIIKKDTSLCENISNESDRDSCYNSFAWNIENLDICNKISKNSRREFCYKIVAQISLNQSICDKLSISARKELCYNVVAIEKRDSSICEKIGDQYGKDACRLYITAIEKKDFSVCEKLRGWGSVEDCIKDVAIESENPDICEVLSQKIDPLYVTKRDFIDNCYFEIALKIVNKSMTSLVLPG